MERAEPKEGLPVDTDNTNWRLYTNSVEAWEAMLSSISSATKSIFLEEYILASDQIGKRFIDLLIQKAREGLEVKVICDDVGSYNFSRSKDPERLRAAGVLLKFFNPLLPWEPAQETFWYFRNHRKILIVDDTKVFIGSICLADQMEHWRETTVSLCAPHIIHQMKKTFFATWNKDYKRISYYRGKKDASTPLADFDYMTNAPLPRKRFIYYELLRQVQKAQNQICITTPYFLPNRRLQRALFSALRRGVNIKILLPRKSDTPFVDAGARTFFESFLKRGTEIYLYEKMIHAKTVVIDSAWSTLGSMNLDNLSLRYNFEGNIVSRNPLFNMQMKNQFVSDLEKSNLLSLSSFKKRPLKDKFLEFLAYPIRSFL